MKWSLYVGQLKGIKVYIHWTFLILLIWIIIGQYNAGSSTEQLMYTLAFVACIFLCVVLHEFGHALTALHFNYKTRDIVLLPIGGMARMKHLPENAKEELLVAVAGPMVNIVIAGALFLITGMINPFSSLVDFRQVNLQNFAQGLLVVNILIAGFNLLPAFPMDGGRIFRALLSLRLSRVKATRIAAQFGQFIGVGFVFLGILSNIWLVIIGIFVFLGAGAEAQQEQAKSRLSAYHVRDILMHQYKVFHPDQRLNVVVEHLLDSQDKDFVIADGPDIMGTLSRPELVNGLAQFGPMTTIRKVMRRDITTLSPDQTIDIAWQKMLEGKHSILPVVENEKLVGVLDLENISEFLMIRNVLTQQGEPGQ